MAIRKDSALYKLILALGHDLSGLTITSIDDVEIVNGELSVGYTYSEKDTYNSEMSDGDDVAALELFSVDADNGYCCGAITIGEFSNFSVDIVVPQVIAAMKKYLQKSKMGLIIATTYHQPGAEKLLKASGFEGKPFLNPDTQHRCIVWTWRRAGGR